MGRIRSLVGVLVALCTLTVGLAMQPVSAGTPPPPDITVDFAFGGGAVDLDSTQLATYETDYGDGELERVLIHQRAFDEDAVHFGMIRQGELWGVPFFAGLAALTDSATGQRSAGLAFGFTLPDPERTKMLVAIVGHAGTNLVAASVPVGFPSVGNLLLVGYAGNDPAFTPHGIQKMEWNPTSQVFEDDWVQDNVSSANGVPMVSTRSDLMYTVGARNGDWTVEAVDWSDGSSAFHWVTDSIRYNTRYSGLFLDEEGRIIHSSTYGITRYER